MTSSASRDRDAVCTCDGRHLTAREIDILVRTAAGMSASQVATSLHISRRTVEYHIASMLRRIAAENAVQAVSWCYAVGVLVPQIWPPQWSGQLCIAPGTLPGTLPARAREELRALARLAVRRALARLGPAVDDRLVVLDGLSAADGNQEQRDPAPVAMAD